MEGLNSSASDATEWVEVDQALAEFFQGREVPEFPRTPATLSAMQRVVQTVRQRTREAELVRDEKLRGSKMYQQEVARLKEVLQNVGLTPEALSESGRHSLFTLASAANELKLRDTSAASFALGVSELALEEQATEDAKMEATQWQRYVAALQVSVEKRLADLEAVLERARDAEKENEKRNESISAGLPVLQQKQEHYKAQIGQYKKQLRASGYVKECEHATLVGQGREVEEMEKALLRDQTEVSQYHGIPTDLAAARSALAHSSSSLANLQRKIEEHLGNA